MLTPRFAPTNLHTVRKITCGGTTPDFPHVTRWKGYIMKRRSSWFIPVLALGGLLSVGAERAMAQFANGNFETGSFSSWGLTTPSNPTTVVTTAPTGSFAAFSNGTNQAVLVAGTATPDQLASQLTAGNSLGYTFSSTDFGTQFGQTVGDGQVIFQQFSGTGPVSFQFGWDNAEGLGQTTFNDGVLVFLDGTWTVLRRAATAASDTAYNTFTSPSLSSGNHFIAVGVFNVTDTSVDSRLMLDNFSISAAGVPEPSTLVLLGGLAVGLAAYRPVVRRFKGRRSAK